MERNKRRECKHVSLHQFRNKTLLCYVVPFTPLMCHFLLRPRKLYYLNLHFFIYFFLVSQLVTINSLPVFQFVLFIKGMTFWWLYINLNKRIEILVLSNERIYCSRDNLVTKLLRKINNLRKSVRVVVNLSDNFIVNIIFPGDFLIEIKIVSWVYFFLFLNIIIFSKVEMGNIQFFFSSQVIS